jgi:hypothetical protein
MCRDYQNSLHLLRLRICHGILLMLALPPGLMWALPPGNADDHDSLPD